MKESSLPHLTMLGLLILGRKGWGKQHIHVSNVQVYLYISNVQVHLVYISEYYVMQTRKKERSRDDITQQALYTLYAVFSQGLFGRAAHSASTVSLTLMSEENQLMWIKTPPKPRPSTQP